MKTTHFTCALLLAISMLSGFNAHAQSRDGASNWPQWRGPQSLGVSEEKNLPTEWGADKNIIWKTALPGRGHSSPIVWNNRIFLTTSIEGEVIPGAKAVHHVRKGETWVHPDSVAGDRKHTLKVLCLDRDSGKILWERTAYEGPAHDDRHRKNSYASSTPVTDGKFVYAFFEAEGLYCYDFDGKLIWKTSVGKIAKMGMGPGTSPALYENLLILQCDQEDGGPDVSYIAAVDKRDGKEVWRVKRDHRKTHSTPLIVRAGKRVELIASGAETVIAYDPSTGKELWRCDGVKGHAIPSAVAGHDMVFTSAGYPSKLAMGVKLGGSGNLTGTSHVVWSYDKGTAYVTSPILYGDYVYFVSDKGILTCIEARTGQIKYEGGRVPVPASFSASAVAFDGKLFLTSEDGDTFVIKAGPAHEVIRTNSIGEVVLASPAISQGRIFIRGDKHLYCIGGSEKLSKNLTDGKGVNDK
jgi:outer membrane protein assembly factor BamB